MSFTMVLGVPWFYTPVKKLAIPPLKRKGQKILWTKEADDFIRENFPRHNCVYVAMQLGVSDTSCSLRAEQLGVSKIEYWSDEQNEKLRELYEVKHLPVSRIAKQFQKSDSTIFRQIKRLNLKNRSQQPYNAEEIAYLKANYATMPTREIAKNLGRIKAGVLQKANALGLRKTYGA